MYAKFGTMRENRNQDGAVGVRAEEYLGNVPGRRNRSDDLQFFGEDNYMWRRTSRIPTRPGQIPLKVIKQDFEGVPEPVTRKIVCENAAKLYNIELN